jgi:DNA-binding PadR family transcriptional regulator
MGNPFASETEVAILRLLNSEPTGMYGLEIVKASGGKLARGTVYVTLGRMEEKGFVRSRVRRDITHSGLPRPRYTLSGLGERVLAAADAMGFEMAEA